MVRTLIEKDDRMVIMINLKNRHLEAIVWIKLLCNDILIYGAFSFLV